jgi:membrane associated rhomboid family serine protease
MLSDRDYMRNSNTPPGQGSIRRDTGMSAVALIIFANVIIYLVQNPTLIDRFSLISPAVLKSGQYYRMISCMFLHGGFSHILFNMWGLYLFGSMLEKKIGRTQFFIMYFISGIIGSLLWIIFNPSYPMSCIGASGAVFGVIIASAMFFPNQQFMLLIPPVPMKLKTLAIVYILLEVFFFEVSSSKSGGFFGNIAHIVHLGGALGGYLYIRIIFAKEIAWDILPFGGGSRKSNTGKTIRPRVASSGWSFTGDSVSQQDLDRLLDKISLSGINSLSEKELTMLRKAREQMNKGRDGR